MNHHLGRQGPNHSFMHSCIHSFIHSFSQSFIHICIYVLWNYLVGQVWPFQVLSGRPSRCYQVGQVHLPYFHSSFKRFLHTQLSFCAFLGQLSGNFRKNVFFFFLKLCAFVFRAPLFWFQWLKNPFLYLLKHFKNCGFKGCLCFGLFDAKKKGPKTW